MVGQLINVASEEIRYNLACWRYRLSDGRHELAKVLVNGSPKSGTTWMFMMIASLPGYHHIGNFNGDIGRYHTVQPGEVVHGHDCYTPELKEILASAGIKAILMVRDPRDQLVSRMFHIKRSEKHRWHERMKAMSNDEALMACIEGGEGLPSTPQMIQLTQSWLDQQAEGLCLKYEDVLMDPMGRFSQVLAYLGIRNHRSLAEVIVERNRFERLSIGRRVWQVARKPGQEDASSHFRKGITGDWKNYLDDDHIRRFKEVAGQQLIQLGYETDLNW